MIVFISYGTGGAECLNPIYEYFKNICQCKNISLSNYTKNILTDQIDIQEKNILKYIDENKPTIIINERSSGLEIQNKITNHCLSNNILNICILDFPGNYVERFSAIPNIILTPSQKITNDMINLGFKNIITTGNPSFDNLKKVNKKINLSNPKVIFISQPLKKYFVENEFRIFSEYYSHILSSFNNVHIDIKLHPQDNISEWTEFLENKPFAQIISSFQYEDYDLFLGYNSTLLYRSCHIGIPTVFYNNYKNSIKLFKNNLPITTDDIAFKENATTNIIHIIKDYI